MTEKDILLKQKHYEIDVDEDSLVDLSSYNLSNFNLGKPKWFVMVWWLIQALLFPLSLHNHNNFRCFILRLFGAKIGKDVVIRPTARITYPWKVDIGNYTWIGDDVVFYSLDQIKIGSHCVISQKSYLCTGSHNIEDKSFSLITAPISIGNGTWIATDCFVAPGISVGSNSVIGARSSVMKSIPARQVAWGSPCTVRYPRVIKS
ncbi:hormogonium polysaccharide biosynthesis acetyltransferase HpsU [Pleurocapsa sp. PCC 7319]|uniref:hormogonium polysaccharide biosynthesis acetyltransferase HpsU n=1 Tax=Pleurocapsa sp. PCC 7319 TaxID=118161 RepID=UPI0003480A64|nr:hormogonium polysaccharide biosynthesis acetyltransferase HpsU [Pleurocapsa sp. PCC 7319]